MVTIVVRFSIKPSKAIEFSQLVTLLTETTLEQDQGCLWYHFYQNQDQPTDYILFEKWTDKTCLENHLSRMRQLLGKPAEPDGVLSQKLTDCFDETEEITYQES